MDLEAWTGWVTLGGAVIAAISGVWSLVIQIRGKKDSFKVGMGTVSPEPIPETVMHVVSSSEHPIKVSDYGFIETSGKLTSILMEAELASYIAHEGLFRGSSILEKRGDSMEVGYCRTRPVIGCYALTNLQERPKIAFSYDTPIFRRIVVRTRIWAKGSGYLV
ncbi:hypothetical protein [Pseudomonas aeruginosa]|uniref:hypothetical protein n=1 Tax=Pseudomonas aeruginosa TaxID=287 RepID=UPI0022EBA98A|nr:hypothetical protein [Pseudomonas aeruginosa]